MRDDQDHGGRHHSVMDSPEMHHLVADMLDQENDDDTRQRLYERIEELRARERAGYKFDEDGEDEAPVEQKTPSSTVQSTTPVKFAGVKGDDSSVVEILRDIHLDGRNEAIDGYRLSSTTNFPNSGKLCYELDADDKFLMFLILLGYIATTVVLLIGVIKKRPGYLMPYMSVQVFVFCLSCLFVFTFFSYLHTLKIHIAKQPDTMPFKSCLLGMKDDHLVLSVILLSVLLLVAQAYMMAVVWSCYKYLSQAENEMRSSRRRLLDDEMPNPEDSELLLPPKYEDIISARGDEPTAGDNGSENNVPAPPPYVTTN
jgi:hypothetical protein